MTERLPSPQRPNARQRDSTYQTGQRCSDKRDHLSRLGETLDFYDAITYQDSHRLYDIYWEPSASTFLSLAPFLQRFSENELAALGVDISRRAAGPVDDLVLASGVLTSSLEVVEALSLMGELGAALEDFQPWNSLKAEIQGNINDHRRAHAEYLAKLGIPDAAPFQLPALMDFVVPHYTELDFTSSIVAPETQSEPEQGPTEVHAPPTTSQVTPPAIVGDAETDREALIALYRDTNGSLGVCPRIRSWRRKPPRNNLLTVIWTLSWSN